MNNSTNQQVKHPRAARTARKAPWYVAVVAIFMRRLSDLAITLIIGTAGVAAFDGARFSAVTFGFAGVYAIAFALLPDALMVYSATKMRKRGINEHQHDTARHWMRVGLGFSVITNIVAAGLRLLDQAWPVTMQFRDYVIVVGTLVWHAAVVVILWGATEVATKKRSDRRPARRKPNSANASKGGRAGGAGTNAKSRNGSKASERATAPANANGHKEIQGQLDLEDLIRVS
jgi:hypothetical protein